MKKKIMNILMVLFVMIFLGCGGYLAFYYYQSARSEASIEDVRNLVDPEVQTQDEHSDAPILVAVKNQEIQKKFERVYEENSDFIGWLKIADTHIDYPVMYTPNDLEDGQFYIHRNFDGDYAASGLPFIDKNCDVALPTDNIIIYGHNMNSGTMFHDLLKYEDQAFYEQHKTFEFDTLYEDQTYEVIAMFYAQILDENDSSFKYYSFVNAGTEQEFIDYVENVKAMSLIDTGVEVSYGDKLITLSTCAYQAKDGRFAVIAKKR